jgi:hypothetical protein
MDAVSFSDKKHVESAGNLTEIAKERYNEVVKMLLDTFQPTQISVILEPFTRMGLFDDYMDLDEMRDLCRQLHTFWMLKVWDVETSEAFQILIMTRPELEGVKIVFGAHPAFSQLLDSSNENRSIAIRRRVSEVETILNDNNDSYWSSNDKGKEEDSPRDWNTYTDEVTARDKMYVNGISDEELVIIPRKRYNVMTEKLKYQVYETEVTDREEIDFDPIKHGRLGILYVLQVECLGMNTVRVGSSFDLIRSVYCEDPCIMRITAVSRNDDTDPGWVKELYVQARTWTNVCEKLLPCDNLLFSVAITIVGLDQDDVIETFKIKGVYLTPAERIKNAKFIISDAFQPYEYGFVQKF